MHTLQSDNHEISRPIEGPDSGAPDMSLEVTRKRVEAAYGPEPEIVITESSDSTRVALVEGEVEDRVKREDVAKARKKVDAAYLATPQTTSAQSMNLLME